MVIITDNQAKKIVGGATKINKYYRPVVFLCGYCSKEFRRNGVMFDMIANCVNECPHCGKKEDDAHKIYWYYDDEQPNGNQSTMFFGN